MPVDLDSDAWKSAEGYDPLGVQIDSLLLNNKEQAFSIKEIDEYLVEEYPHLFPSELVGDNVIDGAKAARQSIIANLLEEDYWRVKVTFRYVSGEGDVEPGFYFTTDGPSINPIAEIDEVKNPDPDSSFGKLSNRFRQIEEDVDDEVSELEERINYLEYRLREELGSY